MIVSGSVHLRTFLSHARCQIDLTADDRVNPLRLCLLIESDSTIHDTVIGDGNRIHPKFLCASDQLLDTACAIKQTVFRMHMQMGKGHSVPPFLCIMHVQRFCKSLPKSPDMPSQVPPYSFRRS